MCLGSQIKIITQISNIKISLTIDSRDSLALIRTGLFVLLHPCYFAHLGGRDDSLLLKPLIGQTLRIMASHWLRFITRSFADLGGR